MNWDKSFGVAFSDGPQFELATQHLNIKWASLNQQNPERYLGFLHDLEFREDVMLERVWEKIEKRVTLASHINFAGIDFNKTAFTGLVLSVVAALVVMVLLIVGRLKMVNHNVKEKSEAFDRITLELEEYKHHALEKQSKLSRELQNERNRAQEMRGSKV